MITALSQSEYLRDVDHNRQVDLDPEAYPIICRHWFGIEVEFEPAKARMTESVPTDQRSAT